jgi:hypothetical protein
MPPCGPTAEPHNLRRQTAQIQIHLVLEIQNIFQKPPAQLLKKQSRDKVSQNGSSNYLHLLHQNHPPPSPRHSFAK